jgi:hypothetical protein
MVWITDALAMHNSCHSVRSDESDSPYPLGMHMSYAPSTLRRCEVFPDCTRSTTTE